jgi:hypothetical protein
LTIIISSDILIVNLIREGVKGMALKVKSASDISKFWVQGAQSRADRYASAAPAAASTWQERSSAAAANFKAAIANPQIDKMYAGGITRAGAAKYASKIQAVGAARYSPGVAAAQSGYESGVAPYLDVLKGVDLPPRKVKGDPANLQRVQAVATALYKKRLAMRGV